MNNLTESNGQVEDRIVWCARPTAFQRGTVDAVLATIGGTAFYGTDGTVLVMDAEASQVVAVDRAGRTQSAHFAVDYVTSGPAVWQPGYTG